MLAGGERHGSGEAGRDDKALDDAALFQEERREGAAGGEKLRELADQRVGELQPQDGERGAETGVGRRLAEAGKQIGEDRHGTSFRAAKKPPRGGSRDWGSGVRSQAGGSAGKFTMRR